MTVFVEGTNNTRL